MVIAQPGHETATFPSFRQQVEIKADIPAVELPMLFCH